MRLRVFKYSMLGSIIGLLQLQTVYMDMYMPKAECDKYLCYPKAFKLSPLKLHP